MVESGARQISKADMIAAFPKAPPAIQGRPALKNFLILLRHLMDCSQTHEYSPSNCNMLFICPPEAQYIQHTNESYHVLVINTKDIPNYMGSYNAGHRAMV